MYRASSLSWLVKPESLIMSMLLVVTHRLWSIIGDSGSFVSPVGPLALAPLSFHALTGNLGSRPTRDRPVAVPEAGALRDGYHTPSGRQSHTRIGTARRDGGPSHVAGHRGSMPHCCRIPCGGYGNRGGAHRSRQTRLGGWCGVALGSSRCTPAGGA